MISSTGKYGTTLAQPGISGWSACWARITNRSNSEIDTDYSPLNEKLPAGAGDFDPALQAPGAALRPPATQRRGRQNTLQNGGCRECSYAS
jgi:hypothetical protein